MYRKIVLRKDQLLILTHPLFINVKIMSNYKLIDFYLYNQIFLYYISSKYGGLTKVGSYEPAKTITHPELLA